ncbi:hypothetical protein D3C86_2097950 [compost metagenome]
MASMNPRMKFSLSSRPYSFERKRGPKNRPMPPCPKTMPPDLTSQDFSLPTSWMLA